MRDLKRFHQRKDFRIPAPGTLKKRFCGWGHDKYEVGVIVHMVRGEEHHMQCALCTAIRIPAYTRRDYAKRKEYYKEKARRWDAANPERKREIQRNRYRATAGVNFWVEAAKESI